MMYIKLPGQIKVQHEVGNASPLQGGTDILGTVPSELGQLMNL